MLCQQLMLVIPLQRCSIILHKSIGFKRICDEFRIKWYIREGVAILHTGYNIWPESIKVSKVDLCMWSKIQIGSTSMHKRMLFIFKFNKLFKHSTGKSIFPEKKMNFSQIKIFEILSVIQEFFFKVNLTKHVVISFQLASFPSFKKCLSVQTQWKQKRSL